MLPPSSFTRATDLPESFPGFAGPQPSDTVTLPGASLPQQQSLLPSLIPYLIPPMQPSNQAAAEPGNQQVRATNPLPPTKPTSYCTGAMALISTLIMVLGVVVCTVVFAVILSRQTGDVSSQMLVHTGSRTRDWTTVNSYSMHSFDEDHYTRFYVCMRSAGIAVPGNPDSIGLYRDAAKRRYDCSAESDRGWPKDIGFLRCIQKHFSVSFQQSNVFLQCLELTEGAMVETLQTPASTLFLGSYNYVALLLAGMGVMAAFLLFTAGGIYLSGEIRPNAEDAVDDGADLAESGTQQTNRYTYWVQPVIANTREILQKQVNFEKDYRYVASAWQWVPLAAVPNFLAVLWSFGMFLASMFYTYPLKDTWSDVVSVDGGASAFPGTLSTGRMCAGVSFFMWAYFLACFVEWYFDHSARYAFNTTMNAVEMNRQMERQRRNEIRQQKMRYNILPSDDTVFYLPPGPGGSITKKPPVESDWDAYENNPGQRQGLDKQYVNYTPRQYLGARYNTQLYYADEGTKDMSLRMTPLLNKVYSLTWVFADGLLFVGMINSQNSPLNENVVAIWFFVVMCRAFQFAATYFLDDVLFTRYSSPYFSNAKASILKTRNNDSIATISDQDQKHKITRWMERSKLSAKLGNNMNLIPKSFISFGEADRMALSPFTIYQNTSDPKSLEDLNKNKGIYQYVSETIDEIYTYRAHAGIATICCHLASLWCMIIVIYHFANAISVPNELRAHGVATDVHIIQICFLSVIFALDLVKHGAMFATVWGAIDQHKYWYWMTSIFTADWVLRAVFIICMIFPVTQYFGDMGRGLHDYVKTTVT